MKDGLELLAAAKGIAIAAHTGQVDKAGRPYYWHPQDVAQIAMSYCDEEADGFSAEVVGAVAWLHDVLEDTKVTPSDLQDAGMPPEVIKAVRLLTRGDGAPELYYEAIKQNKLALAVKLADIENNLDPERVCLLPVQTASRLKTKYQEALEKLGVTKATDDRGLFELALA
jgi:(p)ppGpp synthase/HD superfamily hydrolase